MPNEIPDRLTAQNFPRLARALANSFPELQSILEIYGMPEFWHREPGFRTLTLIILEQQVSLLSAERAYERIEKGLFDISPKSIRNAGEAGLRALGITRQKSRYLTILAGQVKSGELNLEGLENLSDDDAYEALTRLPGIGPWTAKVYLMSALCRPDIWPPGDLALIKTIRELIPNAQENLESSGERWSPLRAVAARLLWHRYLSL